MNASYPSRAIIDLDAYRFNLQRVQGLSGGAKLIPVLKANAYGHGLIPLAHAALQLDVNMLAVATVQEGIDLRENGIKTPILVMVSPNKKELPLFLEYQLILTVVNKEIAQEISALAHGANRVAPIHCKIDTGMGRQGVALEEAMEMIQFVSRLTPLDIQGIFTHFPSADEADPKFTQNQIKAFRKLIKQVDKVGCPYEIAHAANSAAIVNYPKSCF
ncbi:MAG: alanine racemase, partial [Candidatus Hydrogenedentes bacterium]|nr:alanine racemase [Candidatus Hydrogenedentota bacterium]